MTSRLAIFLAEDNPGDVMLVRQALHEHKIDFELYLAETGGGVTRLLDRIGHDIPRPDLFLLDLNLPGIEAQELFRRVREHEYCGDAPIVVVTSSESSRDRAWTAHFRINHYFRKPLEFEEYMKLGAIVRNVLSLEPGT